MLNCCFTINNNNYIILHRFRAALVTGVTALWLLAPHSWAASSMVTDTGQTTCYNNTSEIPCPTPGLDFYGQDANYRGRQQSYRDNGNGTVTDQVTGLIWQNANDGVVWTSWEGAGTYCQNLELGGHVDWRLPPRKELLTIVDYVRINPAMNPVFSCDGSNWDYSLGHWSSSTNAGRPETAWFVYFDYGPSQWTQKYISHLVRCVRSAPLPESVYVDHGDTVSDQSTGLVWEKTGSASGMAWKEALAWCEKAITGGNMDWRLPNIRELSSLVDDSRPSPAIDPVFLNSDSWFWSSTTHVGDLTKAWTVQTGPGNTGGYDKTTSYLNVRCVRGGATLIVPVSANLLLDNKQ